MVKSQAFLTGNNDFGFCFLLSDEILQLTCLFIKDGLPIRKYHQRGINLQLFPFGYSLVSIFALVLDVSVFWSSIYVWHYGTPEQATFFPRISIIKSIFATKTLQFACAGKTHHSGRVTYQLGITHPPSPSPGRDVTFCKENFSPCKQDRAPVIELSLDAAYKPIYRNRNLWRTKKVGFQRRTIT